MAIIGTINNQGTIQGQINDAHGVVTGVISNASQLGGEVVGMRGFKGDKGEQGDPGTPGADGSPGADGHSPVVTASKTGSTTTVYVDGTSIATIDDGTDGQDGADGYSPSASVSKLGDTATITITDKGGTTTASITDGTDGTDGQDGADGFSPSASVSKAGSTATITITDKGGTTTATIDDGEQNVQSDWNEADNTKDDYIKNKPSIHNVPSGGTSGQVLSKSSATDYDVGWTTPSAGGGEIVYCECTDSASTVAKTATVVTGTFSSLTTGAQVAVKFTYTNTSTNPTLNVAGTGAKAIMRGGTAHVGTNTNESWGAGTVVFLLYDGSVWNIVGWLNTTYTGGTGAQIITGTEALNKVWSPQQIHDGIVGLIGNPPIKVNVQELPSTQYASNQATWVYSKGWTPTAITGYKPIGVLQATPNNSGQLICQITLNVPVYGTTFVGYVRNITSTNVTDTIAVPVLYIRDDLYT